MEINLAFVREKERMRVDAITNHSHFLDKPLRVQVLEDAYILPKAPFNAGVLVADGKPVMGTNACERYRVGYDFDKGKVCIRNEEVIYMGYLKSIFGHCITDDIKRCWFIGTEEWKRLKEKDVRCAYIMPEDEKPSNTLVQVLKWFGEDINSWYRITEETRFSKIYVPDNSLIFSEGERYYTKEFEETVSLIKAVALKESRIVFFPKRIYLSRTKIAEPSREMGEKTIEKVFKKEGYFVEHPQERLLQDQIALMSQCTHLAATEGSIAHSAMFCSSGTHVAILRKADYINTYQVAIDEMAELDVTYIDVHKTKVNDERWPWAGPFFLYVSPLLKSFLGKHYCILPLCLSPKYYWYKLRKTAWMMRYVSNRKIVKTIEKWLG